MAACRGDGGLGQRVGEFACGNRSVRQKDGAQPGIKADDSQRADLERGEGPLTRGPSRSWLSLDVVEVWFRTLGTRHAEAASSPSAWRK
jgi:hypothetical protein